MSRTSLTPVRDNNFLYKRLSWWPPPKILALSAPWRNIGGAGPRKLAVPAYLFASSAAGRDTLASPVLGFHPPAHSSTHSPELTRPTTHTPLPKPRCPGEARGRFGAEVCTAVRCRAVRGGSVCDGQTRCGGGTVRSDGKGGGTAVPRRETRRRGLGTVPTCDARS